MFFLSIGLGLLMGWLATYLIDNHTTWDDFAIPTGAVVSFFIFAGGSYMLLGHFLGG